MSLEDFTIVCELDLARDGTWSEDVSSLLRSFNVDRGRMGALSRMPPGRMTAVMNNRDGRWSSLKGVMTDFDDYTPIRLYVDWAEPATQNLDTTPSCITIASFAPLGGASEAIDQTDFWSSFVQCFKMTVANADQSGSEKGILGSTGLPVAASTLHIWKCRFKNKSGVAKSMFIRIAWYDSSDVFISRDSKAVTLAAAGEWEGHFIAATSPGSGVKAKLELVTNGAQGVFDVLWSASMLYEAASATDLRPYLDGLQPGGVWDGVGFVSTSTRAVNPSFLLFEGLILAVDAQEDKKAQIATITCGDILEVLKDRELNMGAIGYKGVDVLIDRVLDRLEGELISNYSMDWVSTENTHPFSNWSFLGAGTSPFGHWAGGGPGSEKADFEESFEGDWWLERHTNGAGANEGAVYDLSADVAVAAKYRISARIRLAPGDATQSLRVRILKDAASIASTTFTGNQAWQKVEFANVDLTTLGTTRELEVTINGTAIRNIQIAAVHAVLEADAIPRDLRASVTTEVQPIAAFVEPAGPILDDLADTDPGQLFVGAKLKAAGGEVTYHDYLWRKQIEDNPRAVLSDGDGLLPFAPGLKWRRDARDRINRVTVTSRGTIKEGGPDTGLWTMSPVRDIVSGENFRARYSQMAMRPFFGQKVGSYNLEMVNFNLGCNMEPTSTTSDGYAVITGVPLNFPADLSQVEDVDASLGFIRPLNVALPLQGTNTAQMDAVATALLTKYKGAVWRFDVPLNGQAMGDGHGDDDLVYAQQFALDLDECVTVRAKFESHSPNADERCQIEGITHNWAVGGLVQTVLHLETSIR